MEYVIDYRRQYLIERETELEYKVSLVDKITDEMKLDFIWRINELEERTKLPIEIQKMRDKWIYTPISKYDYITDWEVLNTYEDYIIESIIENIRDYDFTNKL